MIQQVCITHCMIPNAHSCQNPDWSKQERRTAHAKVIQLNQCHCSTIVVSVYRTQKISARSVQNYSKLSWCKKINFYCSQSDTIFLQLTHYFLLQLLLMKDHFVLSFPQTHTQVPENSKPFNKAIAVKQQCFPKSFKGILKQLPNRNENG